MSDNHSGGDTTSRRGLLGRAAALAMIGVGSMTSSQAATEAATGTAPWDDDAPDAFPSRKLMAAAAQRFAQSLQAEQRTKALYADLGDAARTKWSNFPAGASPRAGISLADLDDAQRVLMHELLRASASSQGYHKMTGAIRADDVLHDLGGEALFGAGNYYVSIFGSPDAKRWAWMLTGHHMSAVFTVADERIGFTPMFTGAQPLQIPTGVHAGWQVLPREAAIAGELLASLSAAQQKIAVDRTSVPGDVIAGPGRQASLESFTGISVRALDRRQQRLLWLLVEEFVCNADGHAATAQLALVKEGWRDTHFAWHGPAPDPAARYYFRVHGPRILIEYDVQEPLTSNGGHVHAITRDPKNDYGMDWLALHYHEEPFAHGNGPPPGGGPPNGGPFGPRPSPLPSASP